jgi:hypothetical protein
MRALPNRRPNGNGLRVKEAARAATLKGKEPMKTKPETRAFKIHPQLLFDVIQRQAGTLTKALCEGVMNSIDAGATKVEVELYANAARIRDDGKGFPTRESIELFFETFGQPHTAGDAVYGTFRMGRGQMFSFGVNEWCSGRFEMKVDIKGRGLDYELTEKKGDEQAGCDIAIDLYKPLSLLEQRGIADDLRRMVRYVDVPVLLNGEQINKIAARETWDFEDEYAYYRLGQGRLAIYNLGVFVNDSRAYNLGIGGTVVAKKQLRLNFARNDVLNDCTVWQKIAKVLRARADNNIKAKRGALSAEERALLAQRLRSGDLTRTERAHAAVFQDVSGRWLTLDKLLSALIGCNHTLSVGPKSPRAEKVQRAKLAVVLNEALLDEFFRVDTLDALVAKVIKPNVRFWPADIKTAPLSAFAPDEGERYEIIPPQAYTPAEAIILEVCNTLSAPDFARERRIVLGDADNADGWTDGASYIAIGRSFLKGRDIASPATWTAIALLLCHEYSHGGGSNGSTHVHSPEFHEQYHDGSVTAVPQWIGEALKAVREAVEKTTARVNRDALRWLDRIDAAAKAPAALEGALMAARAKHGRAAPKTAPKATGGSYATILTAQGYSRDQKAPAGHQLWVKANACCLIDTKNGKWTLTRAGQEKTGRLTPSLAKVFEG